MLNKIPHGHSHAEAFYMMQYFGKGSNGSQIMLIIWNSRDGVTPFITYSKEYGIELQHVNWNMDYYAPNYKPKKGDLIWVSYTEKTARETAEKQYHARMKELSDLIAIPENQRRIKYKDLYERFDPVEMLGNMLKDKDIFISDSIYQMLCANGEPQPRLELVKEDWP